MISIAVLIIAAVVLFLIILGVRSSPKNPRNFARMIARQQLMALNTLRKANPGIGKEELYLKALTTRIQHKEEEIFELLIRAGKKAGRENNPLKFNDLVAMVVAMEYKKRAAPSKQEGSVILEMENITKSIIPDNL